MISIEKNATNRVILELSQLTPINLVYLFELIWEGGSNVIEPRLMTSIRSGGTGTEERYDQFSWLDIDTGSTGPWINQQPVNLNPGQYICNIYGSTQGINNYAQAQGIVANQDPIQTVRMVVNGVAGPSGPTAVYNDIVVPGATQANPYE